MGEIVMNIYDLLDRLSKEEIAEALRYLPDLNEAGLIKEWIDKTGDIGYNQSLSDAMYYAYYDLMIDSETGKFKSELQIHFQKSGKNPITNKK